MRKLIDDLLNKLEQEILDDLESKHSKLKSKMNTILQQLNTQATQISQLQSEFSQMTQYATELQTYIGLREIEKTTSQAAQYIEDLKSGGKLNENNLEITVASALQSILNDIKSFGDININTNPSSLQVKAGRKDQAQNLAPTIPSIEQIKPSLLRHLKIPQHMKIDIAACKILPDGKYLILDSHFDKSNLLLFSNDGMFIREVVALNGCSCDTCCIRNNTVAVTLQFKDGIALVDVEKNEIIKTIHLSHDCNSIASDGQILIIASMKKSTLVNLNDESHTILKEVVANHVALFKGNIYGTFYGENKVCCYKSTGEPLWTFMHQDINKTGGLALDKNGFVYTVSQENNSIVVVSTNGKTHKTILSEADEIKDQWAIDINRETGMMIVSCDVNNERNGISYETAYVYKI